MECIKLDDTALNSVSGGFSHDIESLKDRIEWLEAEKRKRLQQITELDDLIAAEKVRQLREREINKPQ